MLGEAVRQCVEAAGHEYDTNTQKSLLRVRTHSWFCIRILCVLWQNSWFCNSLFCVFCGVTSCFVHQAASFGKCFLTDFSPDLFVTTCRELRVLNAVRESSIGLPLTHTQYPPTQLHHGKCSVHWSVVMMVNEQLLLCHQLMFDYQPTGY